MTTVDLFGKPIPEIPRQDGVPSHYHAGQGWYSNEKCQCPRAGRPDNPSAITQVTVTYKLPDSGILREWQCAVATDDARFATLRAGASFYQRNPSVTLIGIKTAITS